MIGLPHPEDLVISALWRLHAGPWLATDGLIRWAYRERFRMP